VVFKPFEDSTDACGPKPGTIDAIFAPDVTFGNFSISKARAIDLTWNLIIGRGLQASVALVSYHKVTGALLRMAESTPIPYGVFVVLVFKTNTFVAITTLASAIRSIRSIQLKATMLFLLLSAFFDLSIPTLVGISTGYVQSVEGFGIIGNKTIRSAHDCAWWSDDPKIVDGINKEENTNWTTVCKGYNPHYKGWTQLDVKNRCEQREGYKWGLSRA
jgi:hypothetical protein